MCAATRQMTYNLATYSRLLFDDFLREGGEIEQREFTHPRQLASLKERTVVNATGYGARALFGDETIVPVRGQTARLIPQPEVHYNLIYRGHNLVMVSRREGILPRAGPGRTRLRRRQHRTGPRVVRGRRGAASAAVHLKPSIGSACRALQRRRDHSVIAADSTWS